VAKSARSRRWRQRWRAVAIG